MVQRKENIVTRNNVYLSPDHSTYIVEIKDFSLIFSSEFNMRRFSDNIIEAQVVLHNKFLKLYGVNIDVLDLAIITTYSKYEKRFNEIHYKGAKLCQNAMRLQLKVGEN